MSYAKSTENYGLPDYVLSDTPDWVADIAKAFEKIDMVMKANADGIVTANGAIETLNSALSTISESIDNLAANVGNIPDEVANLKSEVDSLSQNLGDIRVLSGENSTAITDLTAQFSTHLSKFAEWQNMVNAYRELQTSAIRQLFDYNPESHPNETGEPLFALKSEIPAGIQLFMEHVNGWGNMFFSNPSNFGFDFDRNLTGILIVTNATNFDRTEKCVFTRATGIRVTAEEGRFYFSGAIGIGANADNIQMGAAVIPMVNCNSIRLVSNDNLNGGVKFDMYFIGRTNT